jgi:hypothetical protein
MAALIIYPDKVAAWIGDAIGRELNWAHAILVASVGISGGAGAMLWLTPIYPELKWINFGIFVGVLGLFRALMRLVVGMFGFDD